MLQEALADRRITFKLRPIYDERDQHLAFDTQARCVEVRKRFDDPTVCRPFPDFLDHYYL